jgi:peptidyl-prolyl cis-trans isomerase C
MKTLLKILGSLLAATALTASAATDTTLTMPSNSASPMGSPSLSDLLPDTVVAKGKGFEVKQSALDRAVISYRSSVAARGQEIPPEQMPLLERQALDDLILVKLLNGVATSAQKAEAEAETGTNWDELKKQFPTPEMMASKFKASGMTPEQVRSNMVEQVTAHLVLSAKANVTDAEVKKFYDDNPTQMEEPERARVNFLTLGGPDPVTGAPLPNDQLEAKHKLILELRDRARKGEDFSALVSQYSEDTASKQHGGEIILVRGMRGLPPEFETTAFALDTNQVSDVITTQYGYHIIKLKEKIPAKTASLAEATPEIRRYLESKTLKQILPGYFAELKKNADVQILDPKLRDVELPPAAGQSGAVDTIPKAAAGSN